MPDTPSGRAAILTALANPAATSAFVGIAYGQGETVSYVSGASLALVTLADRLAADVAEAAPRGWGPRGQTAAWIWCDIDGTGERWHLAIQGAEDAEPDELRFPLADFADDTGNYSDCLTFIIRPPADLAPDDPHRAQPGDEDAAA
jgi:hypothetical protein